MITRQMMTVSNPKIREIGERIKRMRVAQGMSAIALAAKTGISRDALSRIERGLLRDLNMELVVCIAQSLEVDLEALTAPPPKPRLKMASETAAEVQQHKLAPGVPMAVVSALCNGHLGTVTLDEYDLLMKAASFPQIDGDAAALEFFLLVIRSAAAIHDDKLWADVVSARTRIRRELERSH